MYRSSRWVLSVGVLLGALALTAGPAFAQAKNPCNPCNPCGPKGKAGGLPTVAVNPCHAKAGTVFYLGDKAGRDTATFTSEAPLEDTVGTTNKIGGYVVFDPQDPMKGGTGILVIPVASIQTGIPMRDQHLQSPGWLDAAQFPNITFEIEGSTDVKEVSRTSEFQTYDLTLKGKFSLHGQSKQIEVPARITYMKESPKTQQKAPGDLLAGRASFTIALSDFGITGPPAMAIIGSKVSAEPTIQVRFVATSHNPAAKNPCNPCGGKAKNPCNPCNPCGGKGDK